MDPMYFPLIIGVAGVVFLVIFFQYVPQNPDSETGSVTLVPAWVFQPKTSMTVDGEVSEFYQKIVVVHAITGEVISL